MLKAYIFLVLWLIVACNCRSLETRARISTNSEDEHVHIKVLLPKVLRKHKLPHHTTRPHYAKHFPTHYEAISRPNFPQQEADTMAQTIFSQHHEHDFELPAPMPILTTEHEILAHIAATAPPADNDISHSQGIRTQRQKQQQKRAPAMMPAPPPPVPLSSPLMAQNMHDGTKSDIHSSTILDGNVLTASDFLREMQQLYVQKYGAALTPTLMMQPQMQALTKTTTSTITPTITTRKKPKKRKHNKNDYNSNNYNNKVQFSKPANSEQYYAKEQQQQQQLNLQHGFKPYNSNQAYSNYPDYNNNNNFFDNKNTKFSITDHTPIGANEFSKDITTDDIDANSSSMEDYTADSWSDTAMAFSTPIHPQEPSSFLTSSSPYSIANTMQTNNNNNYNTYGFDDNNKDNDGFNPISYQDLYATYSATPAVHHLSTMPTKLKFTRQQQAIQQQPLREQFSQLSSIAPAISTGINTLRSTQSIPTAITTTTISSTEEIGNSYDVGQQPLKHYRNQPKRNKVKRYRLMVQ